MSHTLSATSIEEALETCAKEPVHIPGLVQPIGVVLGFDAGKDIITHISENAAEILPHDAQSPLGQPLKSLFTPDQLHKLRNARAQLGINVARAFAGRFDIGSENFTVHTSGVGDIGVIEIERNQDGLGQESDLLRELSVLVQRTAVPDTEQSLFDTTARLLRIMTGYDRVMVYRFDEEFNGEVVAEDRTNRMESFLGLRFPHWDIPAQARDIMRETPLRLIADANQVPVKLITATDNTPALDMTYAHLRGVSLVHMQYLRNMGVRSSMTLSIVVDGVLWGMFALHGARPKVPSMRIRQICDAFMPYFVAQLKLHHKVERLLLAKDLEDLQSKLNEKINRDDDFASIFDTLAPRLTAAFDAQGMALLTDEGIRKYGETPHDAFFKPATALMSAKGDEIGSYDAICLTFPQLEGTMGAIAGVLAVVLSENRAIYVFRKDLEHEVNWAGSPNKEIVETAGNFRLVPRGSFQTYKEIVKGKSRPWSGRDLDLSRNIWTLLVTSERRAMIASLEQAKFKDLMIDELNHRVRNILALVRSVSRKARGHYASLDSYSRSLEARIKALASAHDLGAGSGADDVSLQQIFLMEADPYTNGANFNLTGDVKDWKLKADMAPIFALVVHEMMTNAVKYGALSVETGSVEVEFRATNTELVLQWRERNGPVVDLSEKTGFGTVLIEQAIAYELGGTTKLSLCATGAELDISLPLSLLRKNKTNSQILPSHTLVVQHDVIEGQYQELNVLVVEDVFMIAAEIMDMFEAIGFGSVQIAAQIADAFDIIENDTLAFAALDVNLGNGVKSYSIARTLRDKGIPFIFVTGYGEDMQLPSDLEGTPTLTKPIELGELSQLTNRFLAAPVS